MQKANWNNRREKPQVLARAFEVLAPGLAATCPEVLVAAKAYIFHSDVPIRVLQRSTLHRLLNAGARNGFVVEKDLLLTVLDGMAAMRDAHRLDTEARLNDFFGVHKDIFRIIISL